MLRLKGGVQNLYRCWLRKGPMSMLRPVGNSFNPIKKCASILVGLTIRLNFCRWIIHLYSRNGKLFHIMFSMSLTHFVGIWAYTWIFHTFCAQVSCPCRWPLALISQTLWTSLWTTVTRRWMSARVTLMGTWCFTH